MTKDEALKLALEAFDSMIGRKPERVEQAITAIKEALAQPEPWEKFCDSNCVWTDHHPNCKLAQRTWVGLTDEEIERACVPLGAAMLSFTEVARAIEAKLKEKNT